MIQYSALPRTQKEVNYVTCTVQDIRGMDLKPAAQLVWYRFLHISNSGSQMLYRLASQALKPQAMRIYHAMQDPVGWLVGLKF